VSDLLAAENGIKKSDTEPTQSSDNRLSLPQKTSPLLIDSDTQVDPLLNEFNLKYKGMSPDKLFDAHISIVGFGTPSQIEAGQKLTNKAIQGLSLDEFGQYLKHSLSHHHVLASVGRGNYRHYRVDQEAPRKFSDFPILRELFNDLISKEEMNEPRPSFQMLDRSIEELAGASKGTGNPFLGFRWPGTPGVFLKTNENSIAANELAHSAFESIFSKNPKMQSYLAKASTDHLYSGSLRQINELVSDTASLNYDADLSDPEVERQVRKEVERIYGIGLNYSLPKDRYQELFGDQSFEIVRDSYLITTRFMVESVRDILISKDIPDLEVMERTTVPEYVQTSREFYQAKEASVAQIDNFTIDDLELIRLRYREQAKESLREVMSLKQEVDSGLEQIIKVADGANASQEDIELAQTFLKKFEFYKGEVDGIWGSQSKEAARDLILSAKVNTTLNRRVLPSIDNLPSNKFTG